EALEQLEAINQRLADPEIPLKESLELYKKGVELAALCQKQLEGVEKELQILNES
ncbi:MAG: exodeoxyribonuclease VII small subunit, partial [Lachnospiraceae bacterium]|nr:exodeoxyribonuclease VII small subunit [Lachnospiraceae bacterium]